MNERIKKLRKTLDLTQQEFGARIGMKQNTIALIEGGRNTSDLTVLAICREFGVNERWLRTGEGKMFVSDSVGVVEMLAERYPTLTPEALVFIERLVSLPPSKQNVIMEFIRDVADGFSTNQAVSFNKERQDLHKELDRQLDLEDGAVGKSEVS